MKRHLFGILIALVACNEVDTADEVSGDAVSFGDPRVNGDSLLGDNNAGDGPGGDMSGDSMNDSGDSAVGDDFGDGVASDTMSGDTFDPCANVGCGAPPVCGTNCDAPCGCCGCDNGEGWCSFEGTDAVSYVCNGDCYAPAACEPGQACNDLDGTPSCEAGFTVGGSITDSLGIVSLGLYRSAADGQEQSFDGDGTFEFTIPLADAESYVVSLTGLPVGQVCRFSRAVPESCSSDSPTLHTCGIVEGANIDDVTVTCYDENPCEASPFFLCVAASSGCPPLYACTADLSCAADESPTPDQTCCELCEQ